MDSLKVVFLVLFAVHCASGGPLVSSKDSDSGTSDMLRRLKRHLLVPRQLQNGTCTRRSDCLPENFDDNIVPADLVDCSLPGGTCVCNSCFMRVPDRGTCFTCSDFMFNTTSRTCGDDFRQDQRTAFLYSFFLSSTGAANFYIEVYGLAVGQLVVLIVFIASLIILICPCCICCGCVGKEGAIKGTCLFLVLFILAIAFFIGMAFLIISWWIGDMAIFANNERRTGNGCFLRENL